MWKREVQTPKGHTVAESRIMLWLMGGTWPVAVGRWSARWVAPFTGRWAALFQDPCSWNTRRSRKTSLGCKKMNCMFEKKADRSEISKGACRRFKSPYWMSLIDPGIRMVYEGTARPYVLSWRWLLPWKSVKQWQESRISWIRFDSEAITLKFIYVCLDRAEIAIRSKSIKILLYENQMGKVE